MQKSKHVTIWDVAEKAGVSIQTVSRVINNRPDVSPETRQNIQKTIEELGYQPFATARGLASKHTYTLGLVTADFADNWFAQVVTGAEKEAIQHNYHFMLGSSQCSAGDEPTYMTLLTQRHVDGMLFVRSGGAIEYSHFLRLKDFGVPIVIVGYYSEPGIALLDVDNVGGGRRAVDYLLSLGHTNIAMIEGPSESKSVSDRSEGYRQAVQNAGLPVQPDLILNGGTWLHKAGYEKTKELLDKKIPFSAIFAHNDRIARGAIHALIEAGLKVPGDISIVGYDDIPEAEFSEPPLTTIHQPMTEIGQAAARVLIQMIEDSTVAPRQFLFDTTLVIRSSCAPARKQIGGTS